MSKPSNHSTRLVYSTDKGRIKETPPAQPVKSGDGTVRLRRETKGRKGSGVTLVDGLALPPAELKATAKRLKQLCGSGGSVKEGIIEIQGDHRETIKTHLEKAGHKVKLAGG